MDRLQQRFHYMDNLRALAMLAGIVFHASLAYSPMLHFFWLTADQQFSVEIDILAWFSHLFRMPLFFMIAGFFAHMMIEKRGVQGLLINRGIRVLIPFAIFLPLVLWSIVAGIKWAAIYIENPSPALSFLANSMNSESENTQDINTSHLWFLYYLSFFYILLSMIKPLFIHLAKWLGFLMKPWVIVLIGPAFLIPSFYHIRMPHPAPDGLIPLVWPLGLYGLFFLLGVCLFKKQSLIDHLQKLFWPLLLSGIGCYAYLAYRMPAAEGNLLVASLESYSATHMTFVCLLAGKRWLNQHSRINRYIADSSYWIYIIHIPVLFMVQYIFLDIQWNLWLEFLLTVLITFGIGLFSYALLVRWSPIGWLLNGKR